MGNFLTKLFGKAEEVKDKLFISVSTPAEYDVENDIEDAIKTAVQGVINECSQKYFRKIDVDFKVRVR